jgi:hypothetical protein
MPTTRRKAAADLTPEGADQAMPLEMLPATTEPDDEESVLDRLRSMGGEDRDRMRVKVYRKTAHGQLEWCTDYTIGEWEEGDVSRVRADWGSGTYEMRVVIGGRPGIRYREVFRIAADAKPAALPPPPPPQATGLEEVVRMLAEGQQRILEAVSQRPDPTAQLQSTLGLMAAMREAMGLNQAPPPPPPASDPGAMLGQLVGAIRQLREVATEVAPPAADPDNPMAMLGQIAEVVKLGMTQQAHQAQPAALMPPVQLPPGFGASLDDAAPQPQEGEGEMFGVLVLRGQLAQLVKMAETGAPVETGAQFVADNLPDDLLSYLPLPNILDILGSVNGKVRDHETWFLAVRDRALQLLAEDDSAPVLPPKDALPGL